MWREKEKGRKEGRKEKEKRERNGMRRDGGEYGNRNKIRGFRFTDG